MIAYLEGRVGLRLVRDRDPVEIRDKKWFGHFFTLHGVQIHAGAVAGKPDVLPGIYQRGMNARNPEFADALRQTRVDQVQYVAPNEPPPPGQPSPSAGPMPPGTPAIPQGSRRIRVFARGDVPMQAQWQQNPQTHEAVAVINQGVNMVIEGLTAGKGTVPGVGGGPLTLDLSTDRLVIWTVAPQQPDINAPLVAGPEPAAGSLHGRQHRLPPGRPDHLCQAHVLRRAEPRGHDSGGRHAHAGAGLRRQGPPARQRHAADRRGPLPRPGRVRHLQPHGNSRLSPQWSDVAFEDRQIFRSGHRDAARWTPDERAGGHQELVSSQNNVLYLEEVPIFYWPTFATDLNDPTLFLRRIQFNENGVFGYQFFTDFAAYQLLGIKDRPKGTDWTVSLDYLSLRGSSEGTEFVYNRGDFLGISGQAAGKINFWGIFDHGTDNLGQGRSSVLPEPDVNYRYRFFEPHRQELGEGFTFTAEVGKISDRNFLLEYFKQDWDEQKDPSTDVALKFRRENMSMSIMAEARLDNFVTDTQWLPRFDHFLLGQSLSTTT